MPLLPGKVILVSGGTSGVGAAAARACARAGARAVAVTGRRREKGEEVAAELRELGAAASYVACDVADVGQALAAVATVV
ncbi:MAG TPA: SDR family NAD(P)-dependent oxidoreductase, partial [Actinomycetes bacterium]|nr:SDR family NAD(P)-dependent oxidoreductase [Actinomycetes bacterium]